MATNWQRIRACLYTGIGRGGGGLQGRTVVPGFQDAHNHITGFGLALGDIALSSPPVERGADIPEAVKVGRDASAGSWVIGSGYDENKFPERRHPTAAEQDAVAPRISSGCFTRRATCASSAGACSTRSALTPRPCPRGVVERDASGRPTGLLQEQAQALVRAPVYLYPQSQLVDAIARASEHYVREGLTSVQEAGIGGGLVARSPVEFSAWQRRAGRDGCAYGRR